MDNQNFEVEYFWNKYNGKNLNKFLLNHSLQRLKMGHKLNLKVAEKIGIRLPKKVNYTIEFDKNKQRQGSIRYESEIVKYTIPFSIINDNQVLEGFFAHENSHVLLGLSRFKKLHLGTRFHKRNLAYKSLALMKLTQERYLSGLALTLTWKLRVRAYNSSERLIDLIARFRGYNTQIKRLDSVLNNNKYHKL